MFKFACRELGMDCDHVVTGNTVDEVKEAAMAHAAEVHADMLRSMSSPEQMAEMQRMVESKIMQA